VFQNPFGFFLPEETRGCLAWGRILNRGGEPVGAVIDSGLTPDSGRGVLEAARAIAGKRDLILTVTHAHPEHTFGAQPTFSGSSKGPPWQMTRRSLLTLRPASGIPFVAFVALFHLWHFLAAR
jgi:hypothetical protein